jgi:hypothetical protein
MAASKQTIEDCLIAITNHVDAATALKIVQDLRKVQGNKSFTDTIAMMEQRLKKIWSL